MNKTETNQGYRTQKPNIGIKENLTFATWNVRSRYEISKLEQLERDWLAVL